MKLTNIGKLIAIGAIAVVMTGCGSSTKVIKPYQANSKDKLYVSVTKTNTATVPNDVLRTIEKQVKVDLAEKNLLAANINQSSQKVKIVISSYRMRPDAARLTVGIMAGCDNINSTVIVTNRKTNKIVGESKVDIKECAAWGVSSQVIASYSKGVSKYLLEK